MVTRPKFSLFRSVLFLGFVGIIGAYWFATWIHAKHKLEAAEAAAAPRFKIIERYDTVKKIPSISVAGPSGDVIDLLDSQGKYTVLNIWATWCSPCVKELPALKRLKTILDEGKKWRVMAVSIDSLSKVDRVAQFSAKYNVDEIANYHDYRRDLQKVLNPTRLPVTYLLTPSGRILYKIEGDAIWFDKDIRDFLNLIPKVY